jgi:two-component system nitrate/nitrite response regulator NarL
VTDQPSAPASDPAPARRVVVAEDEALIRLDVVEMLREAGFDVVGEAGDGAGALAGARALAPDVVLLDVQLPGTDGFGIAEALAGQPAAPVVVLVSSRSRTDYGRRVDDSRAQGFIAKAELSGAALRTVLDA